MIVFCNIPILVAVKNDAGDFEEAYLLYVESGGMHCNDIWTCVLKNGGKVLHYSTNQVRIAKNSTLDIQKENPDK